MLAIVLSGFNLKETYAKFIQKHMQNCKLSMFNNLTTKRNSPKFKSETRLQEMVWSIFDMDFGSEIISRHFKIKVKQTHTHLTIMQANA